MTLAEAASTCLPWVEAEMRGLLEAAEPAVAPHYAMMQYHLGWLDEELRPARGSMGKRIRPILCLLACSACGGDAERAVPAAAGLELLHNFSLIHDDIEDDSATRRHRPTVWKLFGLPLACNAGDGMHSLAHLALHRLTARGISAPAVLAVLRCFDETCLALTEGQYLDMHYESCLTVSEDDYFRMIYQKTGALLGAAPQIGAMIAGADRDTVECFRHYGAALGRAFQLRDDILGIWGDESITGKSAASDILSMKKSLPVLYAMRDPEVGPALVSRYAGPPLTAGEIPGVLDLLQAAGARAKVEAQVEIASEEARAALALARVDTSSDAVAALSELLAVLSDRNS